MIYCFAEAGMEVITSMCFVLQLLMLRTIGILLPICVMVKVFTAIQRRRNQQVSYYFTMTNARTNLPNLVGFTSIT